MSSTHPTPEQSNHVSGVAQLVTTVSHLSGPRRGKTEKLSGRTLRIIGTPDGGVRFASPDASEGEAQIATLHRAGQGYELVAEESARVWVNGARTDSRLVQSADIVELGDGGPVLRFRLHTHAHVHKSLSQAFSDCLECAKRDQRPAVGRATGLFAGMVKELATQTSLWFRGSVVAALIAFAGFAVFTTLHTKGLEQRLAEEQTRIQGLQELLERAESQALTRDELLVMRSEIEQGLTTTVQRVEVLEARSAAAREAIAGAAPSVVFIQGSFGFDDSATGRPLRFLLGPSGKPLRTPLGRPAVTLEGEGPPVEVNYTGTAFVIDAHGLLLTNRHVALPWENDRAYQEVIEKLELTPSIRRLLGYLSGEKTPFEVALVRASNDADVALLRCEETATLREPLTLRLESPRAGDEVIVLGYPTGVRALLARAGERFVDQLSERDELDFWAVAEALAAAGLIAPLASRGIVGQVTEQAIVYDAETTQGGSGGPVLALNGEVVAVNAAIVPEFGGSNLGVPVHYVRTLLDGEPVQ